MYILPTLVLTHFFCSSEIVIPTMSAMSDDMSDKRMSSAEDVRQGDNLDSTRKSLHDISSLKPSNPTDASSSCFDLDDERTWVGISLLFVPIICVGKVSLVFQGVAFFCSTKLLFYIASLNDRCTGEGLTMHHMA